MKKFYPSTLDLNQNSNRPFSFSLHVDEVNNDTHVDTTIEQSQVSNKWYKTSSMSMNFQDGFQENNEPVFIIENKIQICMKEEKDKSEKEIELNQKQPRFSRSVDKSRNTENKKIFKKKITNNKTTTKKFQSKKRKSKSLFPLKKTATKKKTKLTETVVRRKNNLPYNKSLKKKTKNISLNKKKLKKKNNEIYSLLSGKDSKLKNNIGRESDGFSQTRNKQLYNKSTSRDFRISKSKKSKKKPVNKHMKLITKDFKDDQLKETELFQSSSDTPLPNMFKKNNNRFDGQGYSEPQIKRKLNQFNAKSHDKFDSFAVQRTTGRRKSNVKKIILKNNF